MTCVKSALVRSAVGRRGAAASTNSFRLKFDSVILMRLGFATGVNRPSIFAACCSPGFSHSRGCWLGPCRGKVFRALRIRPVSAAAGKAPGLPWGTTIPFAIIPRQWKKSGSALKQPPSGSPSRRAERPGNQPGRVILMQHRKPANPARRAPGATAGATPASEPIRLLGHHGGASRYGRYAS